MKTPTLFDFDDRPLSLERDLWASGITSVAGIDEVGRGALAGPVVAAAVILKPTCEILIGKVRDSKLLKRERREELVPIIHDNSVAFAIGAVEPEEIDRINILQATLKAMQIAVSKLVPTPDLCLVDGNQRIAGEIPQRTIVSGDRRVLSIAAASVLAKVYRDRLMAELGLQFPEYGWARNMGYGTEDHLQSLRERGPCPIHRHSFSLAGS